MRFGLSRDQRASRANHRGRYAPKVAPRASLDHLIRAKQQPLRNGEAERVRSLQIDHELEFGWLLDRQVTGIRALEDSIDIGGGPAITVAYVRTV